MSNKELTVISGRTKPDSDSIKPVFVQGRLEGMQLFQKMWDEGNGLTSNWKGNAVVLKFIESQTDFVHVGQRLRIDVVKLP